MNKNIKFYLIGGIIFILAIVITIFISTSSNKVSEQETQRNDAEKRFFNSTTPTKFKKGTDLF